MHKIEQLQKQLTKAKGEDRVDLLIELGLALYTSDPNSAEQCGQEALALARDLDLDSGQANACLVIGLANFMLGDYELTMQHYTTAVEGFERSSDQIGLASAHRRIGVVRWNQGDQKLAMESYIKALEIREAIADKPGIAESYNDIAFVHWNRSDVDKAMEYLRKALSIREEIGDERGLAICYNRIGIIYQERQEYDQALEYHLSALKLREKLEDAPTSMTASMFENIAGAYIGKGDVDQALKYLEKSLQAHRETGYKEGIVHSLLQLGDVYTTKTDYSLAAEMLDEAMRLSLEVGIKDLQRDGHKAMAKLSEAQGNFEQALFHFREYADLRKALFDEAKSKQITEMQTRYESEKNRRDAEIFRLKNVELAAEISERKKVEAELQRHQEQLEELVKERTAELEATNVQLAQEVEVRTQAEDALDDRLRFEMLVSGISAHFMGLSTEEIDLALEEGLKAVGEFFKVDLVIIGQSIDDDGPPLPRIQWASEKHAAKLASLEPRSGYANLAAYLKEEEYLRFDNESQMPSDWTEERQLMEAMSVKSGLVTRLSVGGMFTGAIGLCTIESYRKWRQDVVQRLTIVGEVFANAINRKYTEDILHQTTEELRDERQVLTEKNIALRQILSHIERQRADDRVQTFQDLERELIPFMKKLKAHAGSIHARELEGLELSLNAILAKDIDEFKLRYATLTSRESEICRFIKKGMTSKQISVKLNLSVPTIYKHRENIRDKLAIINKDISLATYLRSH